MCFCGEKSGFCLINCSNVEQTGVEDSTYRVTEHSEWGSVPELERSNVRILRRMGLECSDLGERSKRKFSSFCGSCQNLLIEQNESEEVM